MCGSTDTPEGFNVKDVRDVLREWTSKTMNLQDFIQVEGTSDCHPRATEWIKAKWGVLPTVWHAPPAKDIVNLTHDVVSKKAFDGRRKIVALRSDVGWGSATRTRFAKGGFHYILLIATGADTHGKKFCVVYDPDVTATDKSRDGWASCSKDIKKDKPASESVINTMVLGKDNNLGALVRYYYEC